MKSIWKRIRSFDMFGADVKLNFEKSSKYKSHCGGVVSLALIVITLSIVVTSLMQMFSRDSYSLIVNTLVEADPPAQTLDITNFMMGFKLSNPLKDLSPSKRLFDMKYQQWTVESFPDGSQISTLSAEYDLEQCTREHFRQTRSNTLDNDILLTRIHDYLCLPATYNITMQGTQNSQLFKYTALSITYCISEDCYSKESLQGFYAQNILTDDYKLETVFLNTVIDKTSRSQTLQSYMYSDFYLIGQFKYWYKLTDIYIQRSTILIEDSYIPSLDLNSNIDDTYDAYQMKISEVREMQIAQKQFDKIFQINFKIDQTNTIYSKKYQGIGEFVSYIGGILHILIMILQTLIVPYNESALKVALGNKLYHFNLPDHEDGEIIKPYDQLESFVKEKVTAQQQSMSKFQRVTNKLRNMSGMLHKTIIHGKSMSLKSDTMQQASIDPLQNKKSIQQIKLSFLMEIFEKIIRCNMKIYFEFSYFLEIILSKSKKLKDVKYLFRKSTAMVVQDLDIIVMLIKLQEIHKLKQVVLNENQLLLFNYLPKPIVGQSEENGQVIDLIVEQSLKQMQKQKKMKRKQHSSLLGKAHHFNSKTKLMKLYSAYEAISMSKEPLHKFQKQMNTRLLHQIDPMLKLCFEQSIQLESIYNTIQTDSFSAQKIHEDKEEGEEINLNINIGKLQPITPDDHGSIHFDDDQKS